MDVNFVFSFKRDYHPNTLLEFNYNARMDSNSSVYAPIYDDKLLTSSNGMVGAPYIETIRNTDGKIPVEYKLRFRPETNYTNNRINRSGTSIANTLSRGRTRFGTGNHKVITPSRNKSSKGKRKRR